MKSIAKGITVLLTAVVWVSLVEVQRLHAQVVPTPSDTGTAVTSIGNRFDISGGKLSGDNANLFHSLSQFGLSQTQIANFLSNPDIRNILVRVTGGDASRIDGLIQVSGGQSNLFLINPAGIVFGSTASLNVAGSFTATTATGVGFGTNWFNASGTNNYEALVGNPNSYAFAVAQPGSIINAGNLTVGLGQQLTLLGGTVVSSGALSAPQGQIVVAAVPGQSIVHLSQPGAVLSLDVQRPTPADRVEVWTLPVLSLPELLTGGSGNNATGLVVNSNGQVELTGSGVQINPGDVAVRNATTSTLNGTFLRATTNRVLNSDAFMALNTPGSGYISRTPLLAPPNQFLPTPTPATSGVNSIPTSVYPQLSPITPATITVPPNSVLPLAPRPNSVTPDCVTACPLPNRPPATIDAGNSAPIINFPTGEQSNPVIVLDNPLPQYPIQASANQSDVAPANPQSSVILPSNVGLPISDPDQNLASDEIDALNQSSATALRLEAVRKYFQKRWRSSPQLAAKLQYKLLLDSKGAVQQVVPLGQEAAAYLVTLKLTATGEAIAPSKRALQSLDVIVILSPDGTVEVIPSSLTLKN